MHLYKEARVITWVDWQRDLGLYKFVDIYGFLTEPSSEIKWDRFIEIITENNIIEECYYSLEYTRTFFPVLGDIQGFVDMMEKIKPANTDYLEQVIDGGNPDIKYQWTKGLLTRFFDMKRINLLEKI